MVEIGEMWTEFVQFEIFRKDIMERTIVGGQNISYTPNLHIIKSTKMLFIGGLLNYF